MSRHQIHVMTFHTVAYVATSNPCRDIRSMSQPPTLSPMSRPPTLSPMSRHQIHVTTPFLPTVGFPGRDAKLQVATSHTTAHVVTTKMMSRHQLSSTPFLLCRDAIFSLSRPPLLPPMSRPQNVVATPFFPCRDLPCCHPCRDLKMLSRHQYQLAKIQGRHPETYCNPAKSRRHFLVATSNLCRDLNRS